MHKQIIKYRHFWDTFKDADAAFENLLTQTLDTKVFGDYLKDGTASRELSLEESNGCQTLIDTRMFSDSDIYQEYRFKKTKSQAILVFAKNFCNGWDTDLKGSNLPKHNLEEWTNFNILKEISHDSYLINPENIHDLTSFKYIESEKSKEFKTRINDIFKKIQDTPPTNVDNSDTTFEGVSEQMKFLKKVINKHFV
tara:strand:- start:79 stop:666 length:588 start_codon:yes stop_codon:yes gene_type:complete